MPITFSSSLFFLLHTKITPSPLLATSKPANFSQSHSFRVLQTSSLLLLQVNHFQPPHHHQNEVLIRHCRSLGRRRRLCQQLHHHQHHWCCYRQLCSHRHCDHHPHCWRQRQPGRLPARRRRRCRCLLPVNCCFTVKRTTRRTINDYRQIMTGRGHLQKTESIISSRHASLRPEGPCAINTSLSSSCTRQSLLAFTRIGFNWVFGF